MLSKRYEFIKYRVSRKRSNLQSQATIKLNVKIVIIIWWSKNVPGSKPFDDKCHQKQGQFGKIERELKSNHELDTDTFSETKMLACATFGMTWATCHFSFWSIIIFFWNSKLLCWIIWGMIMVITTLGRKRYPNVSLHIDNF